jgi:hypothetical protein
LISKGTNHRYCQTVPWYIPRAGIYLHLLRDQQSLSSSILYSILSLYTFWLNFKSYMCRLNKANYHKRIQVLYPESCILTDSPRKVKNHKPDTKIYLIPFLYASRRTTIAYVTHCWWRSSCWVT